MYTRMLLVTLSNQQTTIASASALGDRTATAVPETAVQLTACDSAAVVDILVYRHMQKPDKFRSHVLIHPYR